MSSHKEEDETLEEEEVSSFKVVWHQVAGHKDHGSTPGITYLHIHISTYLQIDIFTYLHIYMYTLHIKIFTYLHSFMAAPLVLHTFYLQLQINCDHGQGHNVGICCPLLSVGQNRRPLGGAHKLHT